MQVTQEQIALAEQTLAARQSEFQIISNALALQRKVVEMGKEVVAAQAREQALENEKAEVGRLRNNVVGDARRALVGTVLPEVTLTDGRKLSNARVMKIEDSGVSFAVPTGVVKVTPQELPPQLRSQLRLE